MTHQTLDHPEALENWTTWQILRKPDRIFITQNRDQTCFSVKNSESKQIAAFHTRDTGN